MGGAPVIELRNVTVGKSPKILDDITITLHAGEILGFVFVHGVGKSTVLRVASGFFQPDSGEVLHHGQRARDLRFKDEQRLQQKMGFVFQNGGLLINTKVYDNVALPLRYHTKLGEAEIEAKVMEALTLVGMRDQAQRFAWELTVARQKLVTLARALVREPDVILFDNFVKGTEVAVWESMNRLVRQLRTTRNIAWMLVLEPDPEAYKIADRIAIVEDGKLLAVNAPSAIQKSQDQRVSRVFKTLDFGDQETQKL